MKFRYARYGSVVRPVMPIKVKYGGNEIGYQVLVDSGADLCLFYEIDAGFMTNVAGRIMPYGIVGQK